mgnify:CR=1 FL=1
MQIKWSRLGSDMVRFFSDEPVQPHRGIEGYRRDRDRSSGGFSGGKNTTCACEQVHVAEKLMAGLKLEEVSAR